MEALLAHKDEINEQLARYGVKFGIYKEGSFNERSWKTAGSTAAPAAALLRWEPFTAGSAMNISTRCSSKPPPS